MPTAPTPPNGPKAKNDYNHRLPDLQLPGVYPYIRFYQFRDGSWKRQDETPGYESHARGHITGSYEERDNTGSHKKFEVAYKHDYTQQGKSSTVELNHDEKIGASQVARVTQDRYHEKGGDHMDAIKGDTIHASGGINYAHATNGFQRSSTGDYVTDHSEGHHHNNVEQDHIKYIGGTKYTYVGAESGEYVPNGNKDTNVGQNVNVNAGQNSTHNAQININLTAGQQITLTVGQAIITVNNSVITVNPGSGNVILGGDGSKGSYAPVATMAGPCINVLGRYA